MYWPLPNCPLDVGPDIRSWSCASGLFSPGSQHTVLMACCCPAVRVKDCRSIAGSGNPSSGSALPSAVRQNCARLRAASALPCIRIAFCLTGCFPRRFLLPPVLAAPVCGPGAGGFKNNRPPVQRVRAKTEKIRTEVLEVCSKSFYLCTTPQGRAGCSGRSSHEKRRVQR